MLLESNQLNNFWTEQERIRVSMLLELPVIDVKVENRVRLTDASTLITCSVKPNFLRWLIFGRDFYQAKFKNRKLVAIIKLKTRLIKCH